MSLILILILSLSLNILTTRHFNWNIDSSFKWTIKVNLRLLWGFLGVQLPSIHMFCWADKFTCTGMSPAELHSAWCLLIPSDAALIDAAEAAFARAKRSAKGTLLSSVRFREQCFCPSWSFPNWKSERDAGEVSGVRTPSADGFRSNQPRGVVLSRDTHLKGIAVRKVRRNITVIGDRDIRTFLSKMDVVSIIAESMRHQTRSEFFAANYRRKQHDHPRGRKGAVILQTASFACKWFDCGKLCIVFARSNWRVQPAGLFARLWQ